MRTASVTCAEAFRHLRQYSIHIYIGDVNADIFERLATCTGFDWDAGNAPKIERRHDVTQGECEQVFFGEPLLIAPDAKYSASEERWAAWGCTREGRRLAVVFTLRGERIRPISARDMSRKERRVYAEAEEQSQTDT